MEQSQRFNKTHRAEVFFFYNSRHYEWLIFFLLKIKGENWSEGNYGVLLRMKMSLHT